MGREHLWGWNLNKGLDSSGLDSEGISTFGLQRVLLNDAGGEMVRSWGSSSMVSMGLDTRDRGSLEKGGGILMGSGGGGKDLVKGVEGSGGLLDIFEEEIEDVL